MPPHWTHITINTSDLDRSVDFYTSVCGLTIVRDRRLEGRHNVWLGPKTTPGEDPIFVLVIVQDEVKALVDHFGFQCDTREEVDRIAERARSGHFGRAAHRCRRRGGIFRDGPRSGWASRGVYVRAATEGIIGR